MEVLFRLLMAFRKPLGAFAVTATALTSLLTVSAQHPLRAEATIRISGSSTVYPITARAIQRFQKTSEGKTINFDLRNP